MDTKGPCNLMVYGEYNITVCSAYYDQRMKLLQIISVKALFHVKCWCY